MKRLLVLAALAAACSSPVTTISSGQFAAPVGLAATSAGDRDLLFIANSGKDGLIALQLCNHALDDAGNVTPDDTCSVNENAQFIPGPVRVFPGTIETAPRTVRVAGPRLMLPDGGVPDGGPNGEALAVGADETLQVVDARSLVDSQHGGGPPKPVISVPMGALGVDVVAANALDPNTDLEVASPTVRVFVATESPAQLLALTASLDANGSAQAPTIDAHCLLDPVTPRRIAVVPGSSSAVYVADGAGDGVVKVDTASMSGGPCTMTRIGAGGRSTRSVALSPPWYETGGNTHPAGEILMMVVEPPLTGNKPGRLLDPGGVLFARTSDGALFPVPPIDWRAAGPEPMQPLQPGTLSREAAFLRSIRPGIPGGTCATAPCTPLNFGGTSGIGAYELLAVVSSTDGSTSFIDVPNRRFPDPTIDGANPSPSLLAPTASAATPSTQAGSSVTLSPGADPNGPLLTVDPNSTAAGVTHSSIWRAIYHSPITGIDRRAGTLSQGASGTLTFFAGAGNLAVWTQDPVFQLAPGDVASFGFWTSGDPNCQGLVATQNNNSFSYELPIVSISADTIVLGQVPGTVDLSGACGSVNAVAEVRVAGAKPWLVFNGPTAVGRMATTDTFVAHETRFDYPFLLCPAGTTTFCYDPANPPLAANDTSFTFTISNVNVALSSGAGFTWQLANGQAPVKYSDPNNLSGFGTAVLGYSSPRNPSLVFTSLTGSNEVVQADPNVLSTQVTGIQAYR